MNRNHFEGELTLKLEILHSLTVFVEENTVKNNLKNYNIYKKICSGDNGVINVKQISKKFAERFTSDAICI